MIYNIKICFIKTFDFVLDVILFYLILTLLSSFFAEKLRIGIVGAGIKTLILKYFLKFEF